MGRLSVTAVSWTWLFEFEAQMFQMCLDHAYLPVLSIEASPQSYIGAAKLSMLSFLR